MLTPTWALDVRQQQATNTITERKQRAIPLALHVNVSET